MTEDHGPVWLVGSVPASLQGLPIFGSEGVPLTHARATKNQIAAAPMTTKASTAVAINSQRVGIRCEGG